MPNDCEILLRWRRRSHQTVHLLVLSFVMYLPGGGLTPFSLMILMWGWIMIGRRKSNKNIGILKAAPSLDFMAFDRPPLY